MQAAVLGLALPLRGALVGEAACRGTAGLKDWAYAGFAMNLGSERIAHHSGRRRSGRMELVGGYRGALGILLMAPSAVHADEPMIHVASC